jgi:hypothetical protein
MGTPVILITGALTGIGAQRRVPSQGKGTESL